METKEYICCILPSWVFRGTVVRALHLTVVSRGPTNAIREKYGKATWMQTSEPGDIVDFAVNDNPL